MYLCEILKNKKNVFFKEEKCCMTPLIEVPRVTNSAKCRGHSEEGLGVSINIQCVPIFKMESSRENYCDYYLTLLNTKNRKVDKVCYFFNLPIKF